jgi:hypothetical protein
MSSTLFLPCFYTTYSNVQGFQIIPQWQLDPADCALGRQAPMRGNVVMALRLFWDLGGYKTLV